MKKLLVIFLAVIVASIFTACSSDSADGSKPTSSGATPTESNQNSSTNSHDSAPSSSSDDTSSESGDKTPAELSGTVKGDSGTSYTVNWKAADGTKGSLEMGMTYSFSEEELEGSGLQVPLSSTDTVIYDATYTKNGDEYTVKGKATGIKTSVDGNDADTYKQMLISMAGAQSDGDLMIKLLGGEILTGDDMEEWTYEFDSEIEITFTQSDDTLAVKQFTRTYTEYGSMIDTKEVYKVENGIIRVIENYENGEKTSVTRYDENGEEIAE